MKSINTWSSQPWTGGGHEVCLIPKQVRPVIRPYLRMARGSLALSPVPSLLSSTKTRLARQSHTYRVLNRAIILLVPKSLETVRVGQSNRILRNAAARFGLHSLIATTGCERHSRRSSARTSDKESINGTSLFLHLPFTTSQTQCKPSSWRIRLQSRSLWG